MVLLLLLSFAIRSLASVCLVCWMLRGQSMPLDCGATSSAPSNLCPCSQRPRPEAGKLIAPITRRSASSSLDNQSARWAKSSKWYSILLFPSPKSLFVSVCVRVQESMWFKLIFMRVGMARSAYRTSISFPPLNICPWDGSPHICDGFPYKRPT